MYHGSLTALLVEETEVPGENHPPSFPTIQSPTQKNNEKTPNRDRTNNVTNLINVL
jgi:hypothetical protein